MNHTAFRYPTVPVFVAMLFTIGSVPRRAISDDQSSAPVRVATFTVDVTIPLGHRCMGLLPTKSARIVDPLEARGIIWLTADKPIVLICFDWCEIRNESYDQWRRMLANATQTTVERVLVSCNHQHDAPVADFGAERLLERVGLSRELFDPTFHARTMATVRKAVLAALKHPVPVTHIGMGKARVDRIASSRRVVGKDGRVTYSRGSRSGGVAAYRDAPEGVIDPFLRVISFWNGNRPVAAISCYATHPMSYYGRGEVSWDFVGMARQRRQGDAPTIHQIYATGCSGDITAGKYNDGSPARRKELADRLYDGMVAAWNKTRRVPLASIRFRCTPLDLPFSTSDKLRRQRLEQILEDSSQRVETRIWAAMSLSSRQRVASRKPIDVPCIDFGPAQLVLLPGESFVAYQLMAQSIRPKSFVMTLGYGECWPGYIPTDADFRNNFDDKWLWVAPGCESRIRAALQRVLAP